MKTIINIMLWVLLSISVCLNLVLWTNNEVNCDNISTRRKADLLYTFWHRWLDWDWDGIACENLPFNE